MPYLRFVQLCRVAAEQTLREQREEWLRAAYQAYYTYLSIPLREGVRRKTFSEFVADLGLDKDYKPPNTQIEDIEEIKRRAAAAEERVRQMFARR